MAKRVAELIRVSTEGQAQDDRGGIPAQRAANRSTAARYDLEIVRTIEIQDVSGSRVLASPEMQELLRLIESPDIAGVVAREFSRLMRPEDLGDFAILQRFIETSTILYLPDGPVDLSNKSGRLFGVLRAAMAGYERQEIIERMTAGKEALRRAGRNPGGRAVLPFGVDYTEARGWHYTADAERVREAYHLLLTTGEPCATIARRLNLPRTTLRFILSNPIYLGYRVYDERRDPTAAGYVAAPDGRQGYRRKIQRAPEDVIRVKVMEGLVSDETFEAVQQILNSRAARQWSLRTTNAGKYLFNGFLRCACGEPMYTRTSQDRFYLCKKNGTRARQLDPASACASRYILAKKIEPKIEELFAEKLQDKAFLHQVADAYMEQTAAPPTADRDHLTVARQIENLTAKRERILEIFIDGMIDRRHRDERLAAVDGELRAFQILQADVPAPTPGADFESLVQLLSVFAEIRFLAREQKRLLLRNLGAEIFVNGYIIQTLRLRTFAEADSDKANPWKTAACRLPGPPCR